MSEHIGTVDTLYISEFTGRAALQYKECIQIESVSSPAILTLSEVDQLLDILLRWRRQMTVRHALLPYDDAGCL